MSNAKTTTTTNTFGSVWDAIADTAEEAANLRVRSELMSKLTAIVEGHGWTQTEAAARCGVTQPRMNDLLRGRLSRFSLDALVNIASALGQRVRLEVGPRDVRRGKKSKAVPGAHGQALGAERRLGGSRSSGAARTRAKSLKDSRLAS